MNPYEIPPPPTNKKENQLQGPRPTPLRINKDSHKIRKPPIAPKPQPHHHQAPQHPPLPPANQPLIIYSISPKPIYVEASNFMSIVQQLTGRDASTPPNAAPVSPQARMAAIEWSSPRGRREERRPTDMGMTSIGDQHELFQGLDTIDAAAAAGQFQMPGILSPAPANLPPAISPGMFSPAAEGQTLFGISDFMMSPFMGNSSSLMSSPSSMFFSTASVVSPTPSPGGDFFKLFDY